LSSVFGRQKNGSDGTVRLGQYPKPIVIFRRSRRIDWIAAENPEPMEDRKVVFTGVLRTD